MSSTSDHEQDDARPSITPDTAEQPAPTEPDRAPGGPGPVPGGPSSPARATETATAVQSDGPAPQGGSSAAAEGGSTAATEGGSTATTEGGSTAATTGGSSAAPAGGSTVAPTSGTGSAGRSAGTRPAATPSRGTSAHRASRPAPVPPAPEEHVPAALPATPATATVSDGTDAPTAPLPATTGTGATPTGARAAGGAAPAPAPTTPPEPVVRTSIRGAEARAAAVLTSGVPGDPGAVTALPGTGPSDASVPYGDQSAPTAPRPAQPVIPGHQDADEDAGSGTAPREVRSRRAAGPDAERPDPVRRPGGGPGRHLAGVLVGLLVGAIGVWTVLFGQSRVLAAQAPGWDASYDAIGVVLVTAGVLVLAVVLGLGLWTPAVPVTAGLVATVVGVVLLYVPATTHVDVVRWFGTDGTEYSVVRATVTATSGTVFVVGALLLVAGLVLGAARRRWLPQV